MKKNKAFKIISVILIIILLGICALNCFKEIVDVLYYAEMYHYKDISYSLYKLVFGLISSFFPNIIYVILIFLLMILKDNGRKVVAIISILLVLMLTGYDTLRIIINYYNMIVKHYIYSDYYTITNLINYVINTAVAITFIIYFINILIKNKIIYIVNSVFVVLLVLIKIIMFLTQLFHIYISNNIYINLYNIIGYITILITFIVLILRIPYFYYLNRKEA